jgi:DNA-binding transcriptional ArsR family regulator
MREDTLSTFRYTISEIAEALGRSILLAGQAMSQLQDAELVAEERVGKLMYCERD